MKKIHTLEQLAAYINAADEWPPEVADIIRENGWEDLTGKIRGICRTQRYKLEFDDNGQAVILEN